MDLIRYIWQISNFDPRYIAYVKDAVNLSYIMVILYIIYKIIAAFFFETPAEPKSTRLKKKQG